MFRTLILAAVALAGWLPAQASAQTVTELTMFNRGQFKGARTTARGPRQGIDPEVTVRSVAVPPGTRWELCSGSTFTGCRQFSASQPSMVMKVRSVRPLAPVISASQSEPPRAARGAQSLRGWASEYFVSPQVDGNRVQVEGGAGEAMSQRALEFCRSRGWRSSAHERLQTVGQVSFLADVLCVDSGS